MPVADYCKPTAAGNKTKIGDLVFRCWYFTNNKTNNKVQRILPAGFNKMLSHNFLAETNNAVVIQAGQ